MNECRLYDFLVLTDWVFEVKKSGWDWRGRNNRIFPIGLAKHLHTSFDIQNKPIKMSFARQKISFHVGKKWGPKKLSRLYLVTLLDGGTARIWIEFFSDASSWSFHYSIVSALTEVIYGLPFTHLLLPIFMYESSFRPFIESAVRHQVFLKPFQILQSRVKPISSISHGTHPYQSHSWP